MNNVRIVDWIENLFADVEQTDKVLEQKEELQNHLADRIKVSCFTTNKITS